MGLEDWSFNPALLAPHAAPPARRVWQRSTLERPAHGCDGGTLLMLDKGLQIPGAVCVWVSIPQVGLWS